MEPTFRRRRVNPRALVGKILLFNGVVFVGISLLVGGYRLFTQMTTISTQANSISTVTGLLTLIFAGVGLVEGLVGLMIWLLPGGDSPPADEVNHYYAALENQDYATAFQSLDLSMGAAPLGRMMTQAEFIERAQAYDAQHGKVTDYSLAGVKANPSKRVFTIKVTRRSGAYRTQIRLTKLGNAWKIVGVDRF